MKLIIAEKPSVARAIYPVLGANTKKDGYMEGNGYLVSWCFGHLVGMYMPNDYGEQWSGKWSFAQLPMLPEQWKFKLNSDCAEQFRVLKNLMHDSGVEEIICATDADREGECIFRYVYHLAGCRKPVKRLWVSSLEESAIRDGMQKLKDGAAYGNLYAAGFSRAKADWLVGMNASRLFSIQYKAPLNLGRVQTPTLAMIVQRDYEVAHFVKQKYFTVDLNCGTFIASSVRIDDENATANLAAICSGKNAAAIKNALGIPENGSLINAAVQMSLQASQITESMAALRVPPQEIRMFSSSFVSAVQCMIAGRLEVGGSQFSVMPDAAMFYGANGQHICHFQALENGI